ncbi:MAG: PaaI family thioesterase [Pseudomonadota bacterium]
MAWSDGQPIDLRSTKARAVLAALALAPDGTRSRSWLSELIAQDQGNELAHMLLRRTIVELRKALAADPSLLEANRIFARLDLTRVQFIGSASDGQFLQDVNPSSQLFRDWVQPYRNNQGALVTKPVDPRLPARLAESFAKQGAMARLGVEVVEVEPGRVVLEMPFNAEFSQHHGFLHAGILTTVMDSACGYAAFTLMGKEQEVLTVEFKVNFLAPAAGVRFRCTGEVVKSGRTLTVTEGRAEAIAPDGTTKEVARMTATMIAAQNRPDLGDPD